MISASEDSIYKDLLSTLMLSLPLPNTAELDAWDKQDDHEAKASMEKCLRSFPLFQEYVTRKKKRDHTSLIPFSGSDGSLQLVSSSNREYPFLEKARKYITQLARSRLLKISMETNIPLTQDRNVTEFVRDHDKLMTYLAEEMDVTPLETCSFSTSLYSFQDIWDCCLGNPSYDPKLDNFAEPPVIEHENWSVPTSRQRQLFKFPLYRSNDSVLSVFDRVGSGSTVKFYNDGDIVDSGNLPYHDSALGNECEVIMASGNRELLLDFVSQHGCPASQRCHIWRKLLPHEGKLFFELDEDRYTLIQVAQKRIQTTQHLTDLIMRLDVKNIANEDSFFVFEDLVSYIMLLWARDDESNSLAKNSTTYHWRTNFMQGSDNLVGCQILPYDQLYLYILPLCYIEHDVPTLYATFRDMYTRFFCHLHVISSHPFSIINLMNSFESIYLSQLDQDQRNIVLATTNVELYRLVIRNACTWINRGFIGYLHIRELLLLWDNIVATDDLYLLVILAVRYLQSLAWDKIWRTVNTEKDLKKLFGSLSTVSVISLLQLQ